MIRYGVSDGVCYLHLDAPPLNPIDEAMLDSLRAAFRRAGADHEVGGILLSGGSRHFSAGADVNLLAGLSGPEEAVRVSRAFQEAFQEVEDSAKPVVAAVAGQVLGGALELAAACHYRVATRTSRFAMPEVQLGFNPGAGGTQRLVRLIGPEAALQMLLTGQKLSAEEARELGLVDLICDEDELLDRARVFLHAHPVPRRTRRREEKLGDRAAWEAAFAKAEAVAAAERPENEAPRRIIQVVRRGIEQSFQAGLAAEREAFAACLQTPATGNKIHLFFATRRTAKVPEVEGMPPVKVGRAAVVGMGTMGTGITHAMVLAGLPVVVFDQDEAAVDRGIDRIARSLRKRAGDGEEGRRRVRRQLGLITRAASWEALAGAEVVIESVFEDLEVKRPVLQQAESVCPAAVVATNTSTLSLDELASGLARPERLVGLHFFNPAQRMPLVEVIRRGATPPDVLATALGLARQLRKTPVVVHNREGFLVNRLFVPYLQEAFEVLEEGGRPEEIDAAMVRFGFPMGPLQLIDMAGLDILVHSHGVLARTFPWHGPLSPVAVELVRQRRWGQKTGCGVYRYEPGDRTPRASPATGKIVAQVAAQRGRRLRAVDAEEIPERLVLRMVAEAFRVVAEGVVRDADDVDVASVLGMGFPDFRGGLWRYAHQTGLDRVRTRLEELAARHGPRFAPCPSLPTTQGDS